MSLLRDIFGRLTQAVTAYAGDKALMLAAVSAAANVIVADGEVAGAGIRRRPCTACRADPVLMKGYDALMLETELYEGIARARTRLGRAENLRHVAAIAERPQSQRENVFLIAADVADQDGISSIEASALGEIAAALRVDGDRAAAAPIRCAARRPDGPVGIGVARRAAHRRMAAPSQQALVARHTRRERNRHGRDEPEQDPQPARDGIAAVGDDPGDGARSAARRPAASTA